MDCVRELYFVSIIFRNSCLDCSSLIESTRFRTLVALPSSGAFDHYRLSGREKQKNKRIAKFRKKKGFEKGSMEKAVN